MPANISFSNLVLGGIDLTPWGFVDNAAAAMMGVDLYSVPGVAIPGPELFEIGGIPTTSRVVKILFARGPDSSGFMVQCYLFTNDQSNMKVYKFELPGAYGIGSVTATLVKTVSGSCRGAEYYNGKIYYIVEEILYSISEDDAADESTWTTITTVQDLGADNLSSYTYPMVIVEDQLYIGGGNFVSRITTSHTYDSKVLNLPDHFTITAFQEWADQLLIGTMVTQPFAPYNLFFNKAKLFRWNTTGDSWDHSVEVNEYIISAIGIQNGVPIVFTSYPGTVYQYGGQSISPYKGFRIDNNYVPVRGIYDNNNMVQFQNQLCFGLNARDWFNFNTGKPGGDYNDYMDNAVGFASRFIPAGVLAFSGGKEGFPLIFNIPYAFPDYDNAIATVDYNYDRVATAMNAIANTFIVATTVEADSDSAIASDTKVYICNVSKGIIPTQRTENAYIITPWYDAGALNANFHMFNLEIDMVAGLIDVEYWHTGSNTWKTLDVRSKAGGNFKLITNRTRFRFKFNETFASFLSNFSAFRAFDFIVE